MRVIIPSRGRAGHITSHKLLPKGRVTLAVPRDQVEEYAKYYPDCEIVARPPTLVGRGEVNNWILDNFSEHILVLLDDDVEQVIAFQMEPYKLAPRVLSPEGVWQVVQNTAEIAVHFGAPLFSWNRTPHPSSFSIRVHDPIDFEGHCDTCVGVVGRKVRWDVNLRSKGSDVDITLSALLYGRIVIKDLRFCFVPKRGTNVGGLSTIRTKEREEWEEQYCLKKWGRYLTHRVSHNVWGPAMRKKARWAINVKRRQPIEF